MSFLEQAITELNKIDTKSQLTSYLNRFSELLPHVKWCGLVVQSSDMIYLGTIPEEVQRSLTLPTLKWANTQVYKPVWVGKEEALSRLAMPANSLLIRIPAVRPDSAWLILGFNSQIAEPQLIEKLGWCWQIIATYVYGTYRRFTAQPEADEVQLTPREIECAHWAALGKTSWEISHILGISERTVNFHLSNCMQKTGSINRQQLVLSCANLF